MHAIHRKLNAVRRRMQWFRSLDGIRYGFAAGLVAAFLCLAAGRLWPIEGIRLYAAASLAVLTLSCWIWGLLSKVTVDEAAGVMDQPEPGAERLDMMKTALAFADEDSLPARLQREQAVEYAAAYAKELKQRLPMPRRRKSLAALSAGAALVLLLAVLPNPMQDVLDQIREEREWVRAQQEEADEMAKELESAELDTLSKADLSKELADLQKALEQSREPGEALKAVEDTMKRLQEMQEKLDLQQQRRAEMIDALKELPETGELARALEKRSESEIAEQTERLKQNLPGMTEEQRQKLADSLKKAADSITNGDEAAKKLAEALKKAAAAAESGGGEQREKAMQELASPLQQDAQAAGMQSDQSVAAGELASALAEQGLGLAEDMAAAGLAVSDTWSMGGAAEQIALGGAGSSGAEGEPGPGGENGGAGSGSGSGSGSGAAPGTGTGAGSGSGAGAGSGGNGSGSGSGSGTGSGSGAGAGQGSGAGLGSGGRTLVTTPRELAGSGNVQNDGGPTTGGTVQKGGQSPIFDGVSRSYEEVYSDYAAEAKRSLERKDLPQSMQSLVESYFTEIDPGR